MVNRVALYTLIFALVLDCFQLVIVFPDSLIFEAAISLLWYLTHSWGENNCIYYFHKDIFVKQNVAYEARILIQHSNFTFMVMSSIYPEAEKGQKR